MIYKNLRKTIEDMLEKDLKDVRNVAMTSDGWQACNMKCFMSLTLHYITSTFQYKSVLLECKGFTGQHTGAALGQVLTDVLEGWPALTTSNLTRVCTTDGASNMANALEKYVHPTVSRLTCVAHMMNNSIQDAVAKSDMLSDVVNAAKALSQRLHRSSRDLEILEAYCAEARGNLESLHV